MREIELTQGKVALVDDEDYEKLSRFRWYAYRCNNNKFYAARNIRLVPNKPQTRIQMHREILGVLGESCYVDHVDGNGLNNTRSNLRECSESQNSQNQGIRKNNTSGYKGVSRQPRCKNKWKSQICSGGKYLIAYGFDTPEEAARNYDVMAIELHGEYAYTNFPREDYL